MKNKTKTNQELFTHHLIQSGYIIKATQAGYKLYNTITGQLKPLSDLSTLYARFTNGQVWSPLWQAKLVAQLPLVELEEFNPRAPQGMNGDTLNTFKTFTPAILRRTVSPYGMSIYSVCFQSLRIVKTSSTTLLISSRSRGNGHSMLLSYRVIKGVESPLLATCATLYWQVNTVYIATLGA